MDIDQAWQAYAARAGVLLAGLAPAELRDRAKHVEGDPRSHRRGVEEFETLVVEADRALLQAHIAAFGEWQPDTVQPWRQTGPPDSLREGLRCFLRRSGAYNAWASGQPGPPTSAFADEVVRTHLEVREIVPLQYVGLVLTEPAPFGRNCVLLPAGDRSRGTIASPAGDGTFFPDAVVPHQAAWFDLLVQTTRVTPATLRGGVASVDGRLYHFEFDRSRRRFPRTPVDELEHLLDAMRLFDWSRFVAGSFRDGFVRPQLGPRFRLHDALLYRPFQDQARAPLKGLVDDIDANTGEEFQTRFDTLELDQAATAELVQFALEIFEARRGVASARNWAFVERALGFVRRADDSDGYDQFVNLIAAIEALFGEDGPGITQALLRRSLALLGGTRKQQTAIRNELDALYDLRSAHVHGDDAPDPIPGERLIEANVMARRLVVRLLRWLSAVRASAPQKQIPRAAILRYLDTLSSHEVLEAERAVAEALVHLHEQGGAPGFPSLPHPPEQGPPAREKPPESVRPPGARGPGRGKDPSAQGE
jgi:hypothetical protein